MVDLKQIMQDIAKKFNSKFNEIGEGSYSVDVPLKLQDGSFRYQYVYGNIRKGFAKGKDCFYITSRCGTYTPQLNLYKLFIEAKFGVYTSISILEDHDKENRPVETLCVQASPIIEHTTYDQLFYIITEVAEVADLLEEKYFGADQN